MKHLARRSSALLRHLHAVLGGPGLMIGVFSILSFGFGLYIVLTEYDRPRQTGREVVHRVIASWVRVPDYLGQTLVDDAALYRDAPAQPRLEQLRKALARLGDALDYQSERFPLIHVVAIDLVVRGKPPIAGWRARTSAESPSSEVTDQLALLQAAPSRPAVDLLVHYRVATSVDRAARGLETSYRRLLLGLLGLSAFSLLCLAYMILHAQALSRRVARESAQEATLDLADRTCHELGNGVFVLTNERRNLSDHLDLLERFLAEGPEARLAAERRIGVEPGLASRWQHAVRREYAARGIDPELELRGSVAIARHVCHQIDLCSDYIGMTVRELDAYLKRSALPVSIDRIDVLSCFDEAIALLKPRLDAAEVLIHRPDPSTAPVAALADRRLLIHALVNLLKNALEAAASATSSSRFPEITLAASTAGKAVVVEVADNGPGIPPQARDRIFDEGFTTKGSTRGRGLAIVRESVYVQGGEIDVDDRPGGGARFRITLPHAPVPSHNGHDPSSSSRLSA